MAQKLWDVVSDQGTLTLEGHSHGVWNVTFSPDGPRLASAGEPGPVKLWDAQPRPQESTPDAITR